MTELEYLQKTEKISIRDDLISDIKTKYSENLPDILKKIISNSEDVLFFDDEKRIMSFDEIINAEEYLHVQFSKYGIIPFADFKDNVFLVYSYSEKVWALFDIIDEVVFRKRTELTDLLNNQ